MLIPYILIAKVVIFLEHTTCRRYRPIEILLNKSAMVPEILKKLYLVFNECCNGDKMVAGGGGSVLIDSIVVVSKEVRKDVDDGVFHNCVVIFWILGGDRDVDISTGLLDGVVVVVVLSVDLIFMVCASVGLNTSPLLWLELT